MLISHNAINALLSQFLMVTQKAAIATYPWIGRGDKIRADSASTSSMRAEMNKIDMNAEIVIGEGEMDCAPMLYIGEKLGTGKGPFIDIAVDPIEGTTVVSKGLENSYSVIAGAEKGALLHAPDMYMKKIAVGPQARGQIDINRTLSENIKEVAKALDKDISELTVMIQERPRHESLMKEVIQNGAKLRLFSDGDITGAIATALEKMDIDMFVGIGGAPEGVISAVALKCLGGDFQGKLIPKNIEEVNRCKKMGVTNPDGTLIIDDIIKSDDCFFVATGITSGPLLNGINKKENGIINTHSFITTVKQSHFVETRHII